MNFDPHYTYLILNVLTIAGPLGLSFDRKVAFWREWHRLWPSIAVVAAIFVTWDILFTRAGVWSFNADYLIGVYLFSLPVEEWLFFVTVPYACVFLYACVRSYFPQLNGKAFGRYLAYGVAAVLVAVGLMHLTLAYTAVTFLATALILFLLAHKPYLSSFWVAYGIALIPFALVNGLLTALPVVQYNNDENLFVRLGSIPVEDIFYGLLLILLNVSLYAWIGRRTRPATNRESYVQS